MNDDRDTEPLLTEEMTALRQVQAELEQRVMDRTIKLMRANEQLRQEIEVRKQTEKALAEHRERLEELVKDRTDALNATQEELLKQERLAVLGQLTATVSHELRNPLGVIRSSVFYLKRKLGSPDERAAKHLKRIDDQVTICDGIVNDLLEYTRGRHSETVKGHINICLEEALADVPSPFETVGIAALAPNTPEIYFDREKMRRVVVNLVTNALQAVKAKADQARNEGREYRPEVCIRTDTTPGKVLILVEDNGIGMDQEVANRAFEPLFTTRAKGTGLGLAIVDKIVSEHGGEVSLDSRPGEGTVVVITIPAAAD